jgi:hypothetical protein
MRRSREIQLFSESNCRFHQPNFISRHTCSLATQLGSEVRQKASGRRFSVTANEALVACCRLQFPQFDAERSKTGVTDPAEIL